jgi:hypothetical protein
MIKRPSTEQVIPKSSSQLFAPIPVLPNESLTMEPKD